MGLTSYRLAKELGVPLPRVYDVVKGKRPISADTALRLGAFFGLPAQFWMNLQNEYDLRTVEVVGLAQIRPYKAA
jgi:addiction module HigA family antidote